MVEAVRSGRSQQQVARDFGVSPATVNRWVRHAHGQRLDRVDWSDRSPIPHTTQRTTAALEDLVLEVRSRLQAESDLGFFGAEAILDSLRARGVAPLPAERTIYRILRRRGVLDGRHRVRRPPPPPGWYLPEVARRSRELDSVDIVEGLVIRGGPQVEVLNGVSLHGGLVASWPRGESITAKFVVECLVEHWRQFGLPGYAQFDNDTVFQGPHVHPDVVGRVSRLCLGLGVVPVFVPPREPGFQAAIENYNGSWQARVWARFEHADLDGLTDRSDRHVAALRRHRADRIEAAPPRREFPERWRLNLQARLRGRMVYVRRTDAEGRAEVLGRAFEVDRYWAHRLVRAEVDLDAGRIRFYRLRRREPGDQPLLKEVVHRIPSKPFHE
jgi:Helix-turn-helix domain of transposase family ISL3